MRKVLFALITLLLSACDNELTQEHKLLKCEGRHPWLNIDFSLKFRDGDGVAVMTLSAINYPIMEQYYEGHKDIDAGTYKANLDWTDERLTISLPNPKNEFDPHEISKEWMFNSDGLRVDRRSLELWIRDDVAGKCDLVDLRKKF